MNELTLLNRAFAARTNVDGDAAAILDIAGNYADGRLTISREEARNLAEIRSRALIDNQRIEIGIGAVGRLIKKFRLSSYVPPDGFAELIGYLAELFYFIKTETHDGISDADLADFMYDRFEGICAGSTELLTSQCEGLITSLAGGNNGDFEGMPENQEDETE